MDYEKKYKEANKKVAIRFGSNVAKEIFQDLYESEDERIRKELLAVIDDLILPDEQKERFVAWLERQSEKAKIEALRTEYEKGRADAIAEQKPADKVEPKFRVGDTIQSCFNKQAIDKVIRIDDDIYILSSGGYVRIEFQDNWKLVEQKPAAWSEEDDENIMMIEDSFSDYLDYIREDSSLTKHCKNTIKELVIGYVNWLKSLKDRCTWKPSDEQIKQLGWVAEQNKDNMIGKELMSLYQDLKKLKG